MENHTHCFGCDGEFDVDDGIASFRRSSFCDLVDDPDVSSEDLCAILQFYKLNKRSLHTPICWDCALFRFLGYKMKCDEGEEGSRNPMVTINFTEKIIW